jgi:circadian clock protein KaiC
LGVAPSIEIFELVPPESILDAGQHQGLFYGSDLELGEAIQRILAGIERFKPQRVVIDSLSGTDPSPKFIALSPANPRPQALFARHQSTVLLLDDLNGPCRSQHPHSVIRLDELTPIYGGERPSNDCGLISEACWKRSCRL